MRNILIALIVSLAAVGTAEGKTKSTLPQTRFGAEEEIVRPVKLPNEVIQILRSDERGQECFGGGTEGKIPPVWLKAFKGSKIDLNADHLQDLIVMPKDACLYGANIVPYWVFLQTPKGYEMVLSDYSLGFEVLKTRTNGYLDLESTSATAVEVFSNVFMFDGKQYVLKKEERTKIE